MHPRGRTRARQKQPEQKLVMSVAPRGNCLDSRVRGRPGPEHAKESADADSSSAVTGPMVVRAR